MMARRKGGKSLEKGRLRKRRGGNEENDQGSEV